jgi:hypothetical protein
VARDPGRVSGGVIAALLLSIATSAGALQQRPVTTTAVPTTNYAAPAAARPNTYAECLRAYVGRTDPTAYCRRLFPATAPSTTDGATAQPPTREPVDITPQLNRLVDAWRNRPRTPPPTPSPPADPLAVIPEIQAACATYAAAPERWRRCTADGWRDAGLRGQPPLALQTPPAVDPPPPAQPPPVQPPYGQPRPLQPRPVTSKPPIRTPPALAPKPVQSEPVQLAPIVEPQLPPVAIVEPPPAPIPPPVVRPSTIPPPAPSPPKGATIPIWLWLLALAVAAGGGFGLARWLGRARPTASSTASAPLCAPEIALVGDPGVVVLTPDGPPRAGMAISLRFEPAAEAGEVRLDYPALETAP